MSCQSVPISEIQKQSKVSPQIGNFTSYSGFFTTDPDPKNDNNMFFWCVCACVRACLLDHALTPQYRRANQRETQQGCRTSVVTDNDDE